MNRLLPSKKNVATVTDMRRDAIKLLKEVKAQGMKYIFKGSDAEAVMLSMDEYEFWLERLEDLEDQLVVYKLEKENRKGFTSLKDLAKEYGVKL